MVLVQPDFSEAVEFKINKPGDYLCRIVSSDLKYGNDSGAPYINWKLQTIPDGRMVFYSTPIVGKGAGMFKHMVHASGDAAYVGGPYDTTPLNNAIVFMRLIVDEKGYFAVKEVKAATQAQIDSVPKNSPAPEIAKKTHNMDDIPFY